MLRTGALTPFQKGIIATVFEGGVRARDRFRSAGYDASPECELCGPSHGLSDSLPHRIWAFPHPDAVAARARALCPQSVMRDALAADPNDPCSVFATGRSIVDPRGWPRPTEHFDNVFQLADAEGARRAVPLAEREQRDSLHEVCYVDGACYPTSSLALPALGGPAFSPPKAGSPPSQPPLSGTPPSSPLASPSGRPSPP